MPRKKKVAPAVEIPSPSPEAPDAVALDIPSSNFMAAVGPTLRFVTVPSLVHDVGACIAAEIAKLDGKDWVLIRHPGVELPTAKALFEEFDKGPALLFCPGKYADGRRHPFDWWEATPHRQLDYSQDSPSAYGDWGAMCAPVDALRNLLPLIEPGRLYRDTGVNIAIAEGFRWLRLPVKLVRDAVLLFPA